MFHFLEPVRIGVTLTNVSGRPQIVDAGILQDAEALRVTIGPIGGPTRLWRPYARICRFAQPRVLRPGEAVATSLFVGAGLGGWYSAEPGGYRVQVHLQQGEIDARSTPLRFRIAAPASWDEDYLAQLFLSDEVGRALAFGGSYAMTAAGEAFREAAERLPDRPVARHAMLALALPRMRDRKALRLREGTAPMAPVAADGGSIVLIEANHEEARRLLDIALRSDGGRAAETFGHVEYRRLLGMYADWLARNGGKAAAARVGARASGEAIGTAQGG